MGIYIYETWGQARSQSSQVFLTTSPLSSTYTYDNIFVIAKVALHNIQPTYITIHWSIANTKVALKNIRTINTHSKQGHVCWPQWHTRKHHSHCRPVCKRHRWSPAQLHILGLLFPDLYDKIYHTHTLNVCIYCYVLFLHKSRTTIRCILPGMRRGRCKIFQSHSDTLVEKCLKILSMVHGGRYSDLNGKC